MINVEKFKDKRIAFMLETKEDVIMLRKYLNIEGNNLDGWIIVFIKQKNCVEFYSDRRGWNYSKNFKDYNYEIRKFSELYNNVIGFTEVYNVKD